MGVPFVVAGCSPNDKHDLRGSPRTPDCPLALVSRLPCPQLTLTEHPPDPRLIQWCRTAKRPHQV